MSKLLITLCFSFLLLLTSAFGQTTDFSPNGKFFAAADASNQIFIWDLQTFKETGSFRLPKKTISQLHFLPDNKTVVVVDEFNDELFFFDFLTGKELNRIELNNLNQEENLFFTADGQTMWVGGNARENEKGEMWLVDLKNNKLKSETPFSGEEWIFNPKTNTAAYFVKSERKIHLLSGIDGKEIRSFPIAADYELDKELNYTWNKPVIMDFSADGSKIFLYRKVNIAADKNSFFDRDFVNEISVYQTSDGKFLKKETTPVPKDGDQVFAAHPTIKISPDGTSINLLSLVSGNSNTKLLTSIDSTTLKIIREEKFADQKESWSEMTPDGKFLLTADANGKFSVHNVATKVVAATFYGNSKIFDKLAVAPDGSKYAALSSSGFIKIWSADGKLLQQINSELPQGTFVAFSPNGQSLLTVHQTAFKKSSDSEPITEFRLWNPLTGKLIRKFDNYFYSEMSPRNFAVFNQSGDRLIFDCGVDEHQMAGICLLNLTTGEFSGRTFPILPESENYLWLSDTQPISYGESKLKDIKQMGNGEDKNFLLWNLADQSLIKHDTDPEVLKAALPASQNGTLININPYGGTEYEVTMIRIKAGEEFNFDLDYYGDYFFSENRKFGAKFVEIPEKKTESTNLSTTQVIPNTNDSGSDKVLKIFVPTQDEIKPLIEIQDFTKSETVWTLTGHTSDVLHFVFAPNGRGISTSEDGTIRVWDLQTGKELFQLK